MVKVTTIITCMTDAERDFVSEAIESVLAQTVPTSIILCVCDTNRWIDALLPPGAADLHVLRMPLAPLGTVRNTALAQVQSDAVAFLDGDDAWMPSKVERQVSLLEQHRLDLIGSKHLLIRDDSKPYFFAFAKDIPMPSSWLGRTSSSGSDRSPRSTSGRTYSSGTTWSRRSGAGSPSPISSATASGAVP